MAQGYFIARPMAYAAFAAWFRKWVPADAIRTGAGLAAPKLV